MIAVVRKVRRKVGEARVRFRSGLDIWRKATGKRKVVCGGMPMCASGDNVLRAIIRSVRQQTERQDKVRSSGESTLDEHKGVPYQAQVARTNMERAQAKAQSR